MLAENISFDEMVILECIGDMPKEVREDPDFRPFMKKGWKTWAFPNMFLSPDHPDVLIVEDNYYEINFPKNLFKVITGNFKIK